MGNQQATPLRLAASISLLISSSPFLSAHSLSSCRSHHRSKSSLHPPPPHPHAASSLCGQCCRHVASAAGLQTFQNTRGSICKMEIILLRGHGLECEADKSEAHRCKGGEARRCVTERLNEIKRCAKSGLAQPRRRRRRHVSRGVPCHHHARLPTCSHPTPTCQSLADFLISRPAANPPSCISGRLSACAGERHPPTPHNRWLLQAEGAERGR